MPFPTTDVLDNFTGTNGTDLPVYSGNWSTVGGQGTLEIQSNQAGPATNNQSINYWNVEDFGADQEVHCISTAKMNGFSGITLRMIDANLSSFDCYLFFLRPNAGDDNVEIYHFNNGSASQLGADFTQEIADGDSIGLEGIGDVLTAYYKPAAGAWTSLGTRDGSGINTAGKIGIYGTTSSVRMDDWGGGTVVEEGGEANSSRSRFLPSLGVA